MKTIMLQISTTWMLGDMIHFFHIAVISCIPRDSKRPKISMPLRENSVFPDCAVLVLLDAFGAVLGKPILYLSIPYFTLTERAIVSLCRDFYAALGSAKSSFKRFQLIQ